MISYKQISERFIWPTAKSFIHALQQVVPLGEERVFLVAETKTNDSHIYDFVIMTDYVFVDAQFRSADNLLSDSSAKISVHPRSEVSSKEVTLNEFNAVFPPNGFSEMDVAIKFKDESIIRVNNSRFKLEPSEFLQVLSMLTK